MNDVADTAELPLPRLGGTSLPAGNRAGRQAGNDAKGQRWIRKQRTWPQLAGGLMITAACVGGAVWYVPRVLGADGKLLTGTVTSSAVVSLNFANVGEISKVNVRPGQAVHKGEVLAEEYAPGQLPVISADKAAIAADQAKISGIQSTETTEPSLVSADSAELAEDKAGLAADEARLATDQAKSVDSEIIAPTGGTVVASNGQPGQVVTSSGIKDYTAQTQRAATSQSPQFSLLPEGPQASTKAGAGASALPVIALRTSASWQVAALVPESSVSRIRPGEQVSVSVPAAGLAHLPGRIGQVLPTPESTPQGTAYQVVVTIARQPAATPLNGMAADITLGS